MSIRNQITISFNLFYLINISFLSILIPSMRGNYTETFKISQSSQSISMTSNSHRINLLKDWSFSIDVDPKLLYESNQDNDSQSTTQPSSTSSRDHESVESLLTSIFNEIDLHTLYPRSGNETRMEFNYIIDPFQQMDIITKFKLNYYSNNELYHHQQQLQQQQSQVNYLSTCLLDSATIEMIRYVIMKYPLLANDIFQWLLYRILYSFEMDALNGTNVATNGSDVSSTAATTTADSVTSQAGDGITSPLRVSTGLTAGGSSNNLLGYNIDMFSVPLTLGNNRINKITKYYYQSIANIALSLGYNTVKRQLSPSSAAPSSSSTIAIASIYQKPIIELLLHANEIIQIGKLLLYWKQFTVFTLFLAKVIQSYTSLANDSITYDDHHGIFIPPVDIEIPHYRYQIVSNKVFDDNSEIHKTLHRSISLQQQRRLQLDALLDYVMTYYIHKQMWLECDHIIHLASKYITKTRLIRIYDSSKLTPPISFTTPAAAPTSTRQYEVEFQRLLNRIE